MKVAGHEVIGQAVLLRHYESPYEYYFESISHYHLEYEYGYGFGYDLVRSLGG
jgi:multisubunit Na+/H+ antiporter MnhB subunit